MTYDNFILDTIKKSSRKVGNILAKEMQRQEDTIELIASENFPSDAAKAACGSLFMCKYTEGYAENKELGNRGRYYGGCQYYDELENYGVKVFQKLFHTNYYFNLQPHSGSSANMIAYSAVLNPGDTILSMDMNSGAHLTHSSPVSFVSKTYNVKTYGTDENGLLDYSDILRIAKEVKPKAIVCGASAYPRIIDFKKFRKIADEVNAYLIADIAHISGLVISEDHPTPFGYADIITFTTHKTFRSVRGGVVACKQALAKNIDSSCFPRHQGGSLQNAIAGKIITAEENCKRSYRKYIHKVVKNCKAMANEFIKMGYDVTTNGTDNHLFVVDLSKTHPNITGLQVQQECDNNNITLNKNCVPNEKRSPKQTSGIRIGTAAMTTKGFTTKDFIRTAHKIDKIISSLENS